MTAVETQMLARVFSDDPMFAYLFPPGPKQLAQLDLAMRFLMRLAETKGEIFRKGEKPDALMAVYPPGNFPPSLWSILWQILKTLPDAPNRWIPLKSLNLNLRIMGQLEKKHPHEPHWYLSVIAVDPAAQGRGLGAELIGELTEKADRGSHNIYLETTNPKNHSFYTRHGFKLIEEFKPVADAPPIYLMLRRPQRS